MNVFYDHQAFSLQDYGGITRIFSELVTGIERKQHHAHLSVLYSNNIHLKENNIAPRNNFGSFPFFKRRRVMYSINELYNIYDLRKGQFDLYHPTYYDPGMIKYSGGKPVVATFHDMINEKLSGDFKELRADNNLMEQKRSLANKASHIIAVSENTKKDLVEIYGIKPEKIKVVYLGSSFASSAVSANTSAERPYLLYVGNRGLYKNFLPFLKAVAPMLIREQFSFVCAGGKAFTKEETDVICELKLERYVIQESVNDKKLAQLYANAVALVFPSLYEGFGIPVLEAFACNCPVILSNISSLPEVAKDAAIYMDPYDPDSMANAVATLLSSETLRSELVQKGKIRLADFSWDKHVTETFDLYTQLLT